MCCSDLEMCASHFVATAFIEFSISIGYTAIFEGVPGNVVSSSTWRVGDRSGTGAGAGK